MELLTKIVKIIIDSGYIIMLPIMITIIGVIFRMKFGHALKAGLMIGIGLQGINLIAGYMIESLTPAIEFYQKMNSGTGFPLLDVGYEVEFLLDWSVPFAALVVVVAIVLNVLLIRFNITKVMNVDVWNFANFITVGVIAYYISNSFLIGLLVCAIMSVVTLFYAQWMAPKWQEFTGIQGVTCSTYSMSLVYLCGIIVNKVFDMIPRLNKLDLNIEHLREKVGILVDPAVLGFIVGAFLGILTKQSIQDILILGAKLSTALVLLPKIAGLLMEGLNPLGAGIRKYMQNKTGGEKELIIGMDVATGIGEPCGVTVAVLIIPVIILLSFVVPGIKSFPAMLLGGTIYWSVMASMVSNGNVLRALVTNALFLVIAMIACAYFAPQIGIILQSAGVVDTAAGHTCIGLADRLGSIIMLIIGKFMGFGA